MSDMADMEYRISELEEEIDELGKKSPTSKRSATLSSG